MPAAADAPTAPSPRRLGATEVHERLAVGALAEVSRGVRAGAEVLVKELLPRYAREPEVAAQFAREAELGERLLHPRIVPVLEHGEGERGPFLVCARVDGAPLGSLLARGPAGVAAALSVGLDLLDALSFLHAAEGPSGEPLALVHGALSPGSVLIDREGRARLLDLGVARAALRAGGEGTPGALPYLAPEQTLPTTVDARSDLYAVARVVLAVAAGEPAASPSSLGADSPLRALLERGLADAPEARWPSASAMRDALVAASTPALEAEGQAELARRVRDALRARGARPGSRAASSAPGAVPRRVVLGRLGYFAVGLALSGLWIATRERAAPAPAPSASAPSESVPSAAQSAREPRSAPLPAQTASASATPSALLP